MDASFRWHDGCGFVAGMSAPDLQTRLAELTARPFAHRGLHGDGVLENSRAAFRAAIEGGFGIELDVQVSTTRLSATREPSRGAARPPASNAGVRTG